MKKETIDGQIYTNETIYGLTLFVMDNHKIALSEMSFIEKDMAKGYLSMTEDKSLSTEVERLLDDSEGVLFYNRLNVPVNMRNCGYGKKLLEETLKLCKEKNYMLLNTANNYGQMGQDNLIKFYQTGGMTLLHDDGLLVFHKDLAVFNKDVKNQKSIKP
jgi:GNAT superfamily N-acetyltransferase